MRSLLVCTLLLLPAPLFAALGTVSYVAGQGSFFLSVQPNQFKIPTNNITGLVSPLAKVATVPFQNGKLCIALDANTARETEYSRIRLDFTGAGVFAAEYALDMKKYGGDFYVINPKELTLTLGDRSLPVRISGSLRVANDRPFLFLDMGTEARASCAFGDKTYTVCLRNGYGNCNWHYGNPCRVNPGAPPFASMSAGDSVSLLGQSVEGWYGHPIKVDGQWYQVTLSPDESTMTATPFTESTGSFTLKSDFWTGTFVGQKYIVSIQGNGQPQTLPVDSYHMINCTQQCAGPSWNNMVRLSDNDGKGGLVAVEADKALTLNLGAPYTASVQAKLNGRNVTFSFRGSNTGGWPVSFGNKIPFTVSDMQGKKVYENNFESG